MDLSGTQTLKLEYSLDEILGLVTLTFKNSSNVVLGTIVQDRIRLKSTLDALKLMGQENISDLDNTLQGYRMLFDKNQGTAEVEFG